LTRHELVQALGHDGEIGARLRIIKTNDYVICLDVRPLVRISLPEQEVARLGELKPVPGVPAETFIQTYARTPLEYLLKPLREQFARTFRER
jgi:hypothetical protein